eukprot:CAMPEP_0183719116 /NCGR_PEP_ID=MMETSP0737-20130205/12195_1 /TAXON_ID=385413 /ORGANISM="Thalassiosira miniscula, Strain CCMP1093" /LENGTH=253 /DNA_ID=CAMNT_0025948817 /DNA_START=137 /DNA_END=898 /DNA_ORIENTATION=+
MAMSSLQQRISGASKPPTTDAAPPTQNHNRNSFESCFSAGLDLTEFNTIVGGSRNRANNNNNNHGSSTTAVVAASAELAQRKTYAAARRNQEEREEAALERRVADVVDLAKSSSSSMACSRETLGNAVPRALHPKNTVTADNRHDAMVGRERDNNFVQFQDGSADHGFLSSLVSSHREEGQLGSISHKSRALRKTNTLSRKQQKSGSSSLSLSSSSLRGSMSSSRRGQKHSKMMKSGSKSIAAKKSRKSKHSG